MARKLYVGNLSYDAGEESLRELFAQAGEVRSVDIITDAATGRSRGFGFVEMASEEDAQKAISTLNGVAFMGRSLVVGEARPRPERGGRKGVRERRPGPSGGRRPGGWK